MSEIWELVYKGDGEYKKTFETPPVPVCKACRKDKPDHRKDCPIASLLEDRNALMRYVRAEKLLGETPADKSDRVIELAAESYYAYEALSQELKDEIQKQNPSARSNTG